MNGFGALLVPRLDDASHLPVPLRLTLCGLFGAESMNCKVSDLAPWLCGLNFTPTVHDDP